MASVGREVREDSGTIGRRTGFQGRMDGINTGSRRLCHRKHIDVERRRPDAKHQNSWIPRSLRLTRQSTDIVDTNNLNECNQFAYHSEPPYRWHTGNNPFLQPFGGLLFT
jgi:hypothetical protein